MRDIALGILAAAVIGLGGWVTYQQITLRSQSRLLAEIKASITVAEKLNLQEKCSKRAHDEFSLLGWNLQKDVLQNHFNAKLHTCFMLVEATMFTGGESSTTKNLSDAFEGKLYGEYMWISQKGKKYWEIAPLTCSVMLPSGEKKNCTSSDDFDSLVAVYLE